MVIGVGCYSESGPSHGTGDEEFGGGVHGCHKNGTPPLQTRLSPLVGVSRVTRSDTRNGKRKAQREMSRITICAEADFPTCEAIHKLECGIFTRFPSAINAKGSLASIYITRTTGAVAVATVDAISANETIQTFLDRADGVHKLHKDPDLNHVSGFPVVRSFREARRDDDTVLVFVDYKAVAHREPPIKASARSQMIGRRRRLSAINARNALVFDGADHRLTGVDCNGMRCFATENDRKGKNNS